MAYFQGFPREPPHVRVDCFQIYRAVRIFTEAALNIASWRASYVRESEREGMTLVHRILGVPTILRALRFGPWWTSRDSIRTEAAYGSGGGSGENGTSLQPDLVHAGDVLPDHSLAGGLFEPVQALRRVILLQSRSLQQQQCIAWSRLRLKKMSKQ